MTGIRSFAKQFLFLALVTLSACTDPNQEILKQKVVDAENRMNALGSDLKAGKIRNGVLLKEYGKILRNDRPELDGIITNLEKEGTENGQQYLFLKTRLTELKNHTAQVGNPGQLIPEADALSLAANPVNYSNALSDPVNVMADMSNGKLARVGVISKGEEAAYNEAKDYGVGSQMIGNPAYGHWNNSGGTSFWEFYGMYSMFNALTGGNRVYHRDWNRHRPYSHYQDYGVDRYGSSRERSKYRSSYGKSSGVSDVSANKKTFGGDRKSSSLSSGNAGQSGNSGVSQRNSGSLRSGGGVSQRKASSLSSSSSGRSWGSNSGSLRSSSTYTRSSSGGK